MRFHGQSAHARAGIVLVIALSMLGSTGAWAEPPAGTWDTNDALGPTPSSDAPTVSNAGGDCGCPPALQAGSQISAIVAQNLSQPQGICAAVTPLITANACAAGDLVAAAAQYPQHLQELAQCLSNIQSGLNSTIPDEAAKVQKVVSCASPSFQAAYAESYVPTESASADTTGSVAATSGGATGGSSGGGPGGSSGGGFGTLGSGTGGFGANLVSPH